MAPPTLLTLPQEVRYLMYDTIVNTHHILSIIRQVASIIRSPPTFLSRYKTITY